jgi:succinoglycan biosynthesis transport protein ExoP
MSTTPPVIACVLQYAAALRRHWRFWVIPTAVMTLGALVFAVTKPDQWQATQVLHVRNEAAGTSDGRGAFTSVDAMQTAQETMVELARNQGALSDALREVGPPSNRRSGGEWPSAEDVDSLRDSITIKAPGGAQFGRTEVIHVSVKSKSRERAVALTAAVCNQLEKNLQGLRDKRTGGVIQELVKAQQLAQIDLQASTHKLEELEAQIGGDLHEIRILNQSGTGESNLRTSLTQIKNDLRAAKNAHEEKLQQLTHIESARKDASQVVAMPNRLLEAQPALKRLKDGLVDAQLRAAELEGTMSKDHPKVRAALEAKQQVLAELRDELQVATRSLDADIAISGKLIQSLEKQRAEVEQRLDRLAGLRARYHNLDAETRQRGELLQKASKDLADARASHAAAGASSLITRIDEPQLGTYPLGPGRTTICLAGLIGGLATGMGLVFLVSPEGKAVGRRWSDSVATFSRRATDMLPGFGRRKSDQSGGNRAGDPPPPIPGGRRESDPPPVEEVLVEVTSSRDRRGAGDRRQGER